MGSGPSGTYSCQPCIGSRVQCGATYCSVVNSRKLYVQRGLVTGTTAREAVDCSRHVTPHVWHAGPVATAWPLDVCVPTGVMSQHLAQLPVGASLDFKHIAFNVKEQYPFRARELVMIVGGTGIAPMLQALHAVLGHAADQSHTTLLYSSQSEADILARGTLDAWETANPRRLRVHHTLTREPETSRWTGRRGRIDADMLLELLPPPSASVLIFVCGPPGMYDALSGPRTEANLSGLLAEMGYGADQVVKF